MRAIQPQKRNCLKLLCSCDNVLQGHGEEKSQPRVPLGCIAQAEACVAKTQRRLDGGAQYWAIAGEGNHGSEEGPACTVAVVERELPQPGMRAFMVNSRGGHSMHRVVILVPAFPGGSVDVSYGSQFSQQVGQPVAAFRIAIVQVAISPRVFAAWKKHSTRCNAK